MEKEILMKTPKACVVPDLTAVPVEFGTFLLL